VGRQGSDRGAAKGGPERHSAKGRVRAFLPMSSPVADGSTAETSRKFSTMKTPCHTRHRISRNEAVVTQCLSSSAPSRARQRANGEASDRTVR
jgi:hypothetical protein